MISVIVLTYNQEQYIRQTLDSILMQEVDEPLEIVIGDDHSSDATSDICRNYQEKYPDKIRYFYNTPNLGLVANFIAMLKQCRGNYCALCDGDDYWITSDKLQRQMDIMRADRDCVLVHTHRYLLVNNQVVEQNPLALDYAQNPKNLLHFCFVMYLRYFSDWIWCVIFCRNMSDYIYCKIGVCRIIPCGSILAQKVLSDIFR